MTVQVSDRLSQLYVGNGANTRFDFMFRAYEQEDETGIGVRVKVGNEFEFIDESEYAVTLNPDDMGGYVTFVIPPSAETFFYIAGKTPVDQLLDITNYDNFYPDAIERALDKLTAILQEWGHLVDFETQARILADIDYDQLAIQREAELKAYIDGIASSIIGQPVVGLPAHFVIDGEENQHQINNQTIRTIKSVSDLINIRNPRNGQVVFVRDDSINYSYDGTSWQIASKTKISDDGEFQVLSNGVWKTKDPSYYDFGAKVDGVTDDTDAFIAYHKKFKKAHLDGKMHLRPIDIDQFISNQNLGLDISGDGNTKSCFVFDGEKGFYSASNSFFRGLSLKNIALEKKDPTKTGIGLYIGSGGAEQINLEFVGYDGWGFGRATHQWNSSFVGEVFRDCKHPLAVYGTSSNHSNCYANRCTSPYLFGYAVSSDGVVTVPSIPFAYSDLSGIAADDCGNDGSVYKIGYCSGIDLNSLSCERAQGEYIFDLTDVSQSAISKTYLNNFSMYVNEYNPNLVGIFKSPTGKRPNFIVDGITISSDKNIVLFSGTGAGCEIKNYSFNDRVWSSLTTDASALTINDVQIGDGSESTGEQGFIVSANNDSYARVKTIKGRCFIDPATQKVTFFGGSLNERLGVGIMVACKVTLHPLNRNGNNSGEKHGEVFFSSAMDYNAKDMSGHLNVVRTGTLTTLTTVSRNFSTDPILSFDLVVESTSPGTRFLVDFEYTYNGIQNANGKCWTVQNK
ncbi:hypothetical protein MJ038_18720 [Acinetobacter baumannii]|uniref:hypothetical protein n=1 Tax=Acinetobacter baumannii TaxID=470 RepID=UPI0022EB11C6|nr:hypothetical protein [Acinetobacter baumannii]MDA3537748.1 hypothetical protein [Acinetobacter baumannii]